MGEPWFPLTPSFSGLRRGKISLKVHFVDFMGEPWFPQKEGVRGNVVPPLN